MDFCLGMRKPWSEAELKVLPLAFKTFYSTGKAPGAAAIKNAVAMFPVLSARTLPQIKSRVFHEILKCNKK
jgi:hypothetical protein